MVGKIINRTSKVLIVKETFFGIYFVLKRIGKQKLEKTRTNL
jgi:hypothetical protein